MRMDRKLTQHQVAETLNINKNFIYELELNKKKPTIYALHKVYLFLGYIPKNLRVDKTTLQGKLFTHRIINGFTYSKIAKQIGLDKSTIARFERNEKFKNETIKKIEDYLSKK